MEKIEWKGTTLLGPIPPVLVTCGSLEKPNIFTVAWTGILNSQPPKTYISVRPGRCSYPLLRKHHAFCINLPTVTMARSVDFCGVRSGAQIDKFAHCHFTALPASKVAAPRIDECPVTLECHITDRIPLGSHDMFLADIVAVQVDASLLDPQGKLHLEQANLLAFAHGDYFSLGSRVGSFGYSVRKRPKSKKASKNR